MVWRQRIHAETAVTHSHRGDALVGVAEAARVAQYSVVRVEVYIDPARGDN